MKLCQRRIVPVVMAMLTASVSAQTDQPTVYTWTDYSPSGSNLRAYNSHFVPMVRSGVGDSGHTSGTAVADDIVGLIHNRMYVVSPPTLDASHVCILIQGFGMHSACNLRHHASDTVVVPGGWTNGTFNCGSGSFSSPWPDPCIASPTYDDTHDLTNSPWTSHSRTAAKSWMQDFIDEYKAKQTYYASLTPAVTIPDPTMFQFDYETDDFAGGGDLNTPVKWKWIIADGRWSSEGIPGYPDGMGGYKSLSTIYDEQYADLGLPSDPTTAFNSSHALVWFYNRPFYLWVHKVYNTSLEGMLKETAYDVIHDETDGFGEAVQTGSFVTSAGTDGLLCEEGPGACRDPGGDLGYRGIVTSAYNTWTYVYRVIDYTFVSVSCLDVNSWTSFADQFSPALAAEPAGAELSGESQWAASLRIHRYELQSFFQSSYDTVRVLAPWIQIVGWTQNSHTITKADMVDEFALLRAAHAPSIMMWSEGTEGATPFGDEFDAFNDAYSIGVTAYTVRRGTETFLGFGGAHDVARLWNIQDGSDVRVAANSRKEAALDVDLEGVSSTNGHG